VRAGREDSLDAVARDDRVEDRPDAVVARNRSEELGVIVTRRPRLEYLQLGVIRAMEEQVVLHDEVRQQLVQRTRARRRVQGPISGASGGDQSVERVAPRAIRRERRALGRPGDVDTEPLAQPPSRNSERPRRT